MYVKFWLLTIASLLIKPKSIKLLSAGLLTISRRAIQNIRAEITLASNKFLTKEGYPSPKAAGLADIPKIADIVLFLAAVPSYLLSPDV